MPRDVKGEAQKDRRRYDSSGRQAQARRNRRAVLDSAHRRFLESGYAATTLAGVADEAGVSVETVYKAFGNKAGLVKAVFDVAVAGDDEPVPVAERDFVRRIEAEPDARRKLALWGDHVADSGSRTAAVQLLVRDAAASDPAAAVVWDQMLTEQLTGMGMFASHLDRGGHLRPGVSFDEARDVLTAYISAELFHFFVVRRGWEPARFGRWVTHALVAALLP
jgi:AcrR family transcriptional regulator